MFQNVILFNVERTAAFESHSIEYELVLDKLILIFQVRLLDKY